MRLKTRVFGLTLLTTDVDGKANLDIPEFTLLRFSGVRTRVKVKGPFGVTLSKTKGWVLTPFEVKSGPIQGEATINGGS
jgi:hypothetical protein